jgi:hypothetical protein
MPLNPFVLKQMKDGTLNILRLQGQALDERDYKMLNVYIRTTQSLKALDLTYMHGAFEQLADAIKQNTSLVTLGLGQVVQDHNMPVLIDVLRSNKTISSLNLDNNYFQGFGLAQLARFLQQEDTVTHLSMENVQTAEEDDAGFGGRRRRAGTGIDKISEAVKDSQNLLHLSPGSPETDSVCIANRAAAENLLTSSLAGADKLSAAEIERFSRRLPAILFLAENETVKDKAAIAKLLLDVEDAAATAGIGFAMPERYAPLAADMPKPFRPSADKVDFAKVGAPDLTGASGPSLMYKALEAGQADELLSCMSACGRRLSAADCLVKPEGKRENLIGLLARQGKLAEVMTVDNWLGDPRGLKEAAAAVPPREWRRQLKDLPIEQLIYQVNAATFKKARQSGPRLG